jgi:hypothetical protein
MTSNAMSVRLPVDSHVQALPPGDTSRLTNRSMMTPSWLERSLERIPLMLQRIQNARGS